MPSLNATPRDWQQKALCAWSQEGKGVVAAVTGAGKTVFALLCVDRFLRDTADGRVLIIVPTAALLDQWYVALVDDFEVDPAEIATLGGGKRDWGSKRFVVAVINTARIVAEKISCEVPTFIIVDECHRAGSPENAKALAGTYRCALGLSATPERQYDDGFQQYVKPVLGSVIYTYGYEDAYRDGVIAPFALTNVRFRLSSREQREYDILTRRIAALQGKSLEGEQAHRLESLLRRRARVSSSSPLRVPLAVKLALAHRSQRMIVFHESTSRANEIHALLVRKGVRATIYHTGLSEVRRRENLRLFKRGHYTCMVCCRALDEGLNVPSTTVGIIASSTSSLRQRIQRLGRVLRKLPDKDSASVFTLFATPVEERRLTDEAQRLSGISSVAWLCAEVRGG